MHRELEEEREIAVFFRRICHRVLQQRLLRWLGVLGLIGAGLCLLCNLVSLWVPFYWGTRIGFGLFFASLLCAVCCVAITWPRRAEVARICDAVGGRERFSTYLECRGKQDLMSRLQREDARKQVALIPWKERLPLWISGKVYLGMAFLLAGSVICSIYPTTAKMEAEKAHVISAQKKKAEEKIEKAQKALEKQQEAGELSKEDLEKINSILEQSKREFAEGKDESELRKAGERLETKLLREIASQDSSAISAEAAKSLQELASDQDLEALAEYQQALRQLTEQSSTIAAAREELADLGELLEASEQNTLISSLQQAALDGTVTPQELSDALLGLQEANATYAEATMQGQQESSDSSENREKKNTEQGGAGNGEGNAEEKGQNTESSQGDGQSQANGQNARDGQGTGGGQEGGNGLGGGMNRGSDRGMERTEKAGKAEEVWIPSKTGDDEDLKGQKKGSSSERVKTKRGITRAGKKAKVGAVSGEYRAQAYSKLQRQKIPDSMEDLVKQYFSELE